MSDSQAGLERKVDRHVGACRAMGHGAARMAQTAMLLGALSGAPSASGDLFYSYTSFAVTSTGPAVFFDIDYMTGVIGVFYSASATPGDFTAYPTAEFMITVGAFGPTFYDNLTDSKTMYITSAADGPFYYLGYVYPYEVGVGYTIDASSAWASISTPPAVKGEISSYAETHMSKTTGDWYGLATGITGHVAFKFYDTSTKTSTFGSIYLYVYDIPSAGPPPPPGTAKFTPLFVQWDSTATSVVSAVGVPEPSGVVLGLLALGAAGLGKWRRRKDEEETAA